LIGSNAVCGAIFFVSSRLEVGRNAIVGTVVPFWNWRKLAFNDNHSKVIYQVEEHASDADGVYARLNGH
jgi:hypothetical protein